MELEGTINADLSDLGLLAARESLAGETVTPPPPKTFAEKYADLCGAVELPEDFSLRVKRNRLGTGEP